MRLIKSFGLILLSLAGVAASAQTFEVDGINYNVLSEAEGTVEVANGNYSGDVVIPAEVSHAGSTYRVMAIGDDAFFRCDALKSISMLSVTTIGDYAFNYCTALKSVEMPSVTTIGGGAFATCWSLPSVEMPSATTIGDNAFNSCTALKSVEMPSVTTIGDGAFATCWSLPSVEMPSATTIGDNAFASCYEMDSVFIPASCTSIGFNPFTSCKELKEIVVDENNPNYSSVDGVLYDKDKTILIGWPTAKGNVDILPSVTTIGDWALAFCIALRSVSMPSVTTIGDNAFFSCDILKSVSIPSAITIGDNAFSYCDGLTSVDMPASVTTIGDRAFYDCFGLTSVYCHWEDPLECDPRFENTVLETATLYVPTGTVDAYRTVKPWSEFANIEEGGYSGIADATASEVVIKVIDGAIVIEGGDGTVSMPTVEVYSAGGQCVYRGTDSSIGGLGHGVYVVKVGGTVQKVAL